MLPLLLNHIYENTGSNSNQLMKLLVMTYGDIPDLGVGIFQPLS
jgi:hypothetical protein